MSKSVRKQSIDRQYWSLIVSLILVIDTMLHRGAQLVEIIAMKFQTRYTFGRVVKARRCVGYLYVICVNRVENLEKVDWKF